MRVFVEKQRFNQWFMHLIVWGSLAIIAYAVYKVNANGAEKLGQTGLIIFNGTMVLSAVFLFLLYAISLRTRIDEKGIYYQMFPLHLKMKLIRWSELKECHTRSYSAMGEYGGWGYKISLSGSGKAYNTSGNQGIQLQFISGKKLLIGTQRPTEAQRTIDQYFKTQS
ncbi:DUF6141 family protein [Spongiivirga sp. MCCC 1A20706]|uniref:DUF6141 family protein n=1 Tax=Spongiivirga sp. MCCC 1A20706 TaxID=3160963 RepID=UPI003977619B